MTQRWLLGLLAGSALIGSALTGCSDGQGSPAGTGGSANGGSGAQARGGATADGGGLSAGGRAEQGSGGAGNGPTGGASGGRAGGSAGGQASGGSSPANGGRAEAGGSSSGGATSQAGGRSSSAGAANGGTSGGGVSAAGAGGKGNSGGTGGTTGMSGGTGAAGGSAGGPNGGPLKIWIAGDSTVQNCSSACPCGWGGQFDALFNSNVTVQNSAVGGRSVQTWLYDANVSSTLTNGECALTSTAYNARWTAMTNATSGMKSGDYLFVQFGINDGDSTCPRHVGLTLFKSYLGAMAQAAKDRGAQAVFLTPVSAISCNSSGKAVGTRGGFVTATIEAGSTYGVPVIDLHQLSVDLYNSLGLCPNDSDYTSGKVGAFFCEDHTHFEAAGAQQIAKIIAKALRDQKLGLASYLL